MNRRTKIVATVGPASEGPEVLEALMRAGVDVVRLNLSHGPLDERHGRSVERVEVNRYPLTMDGSPLRQVLDFGATTLGQQPHDSARLLGSCLEYRYNFYRFFFG